MLNRTYTFALSAFVAFNFASTAQAQTKYDEVKKILNHVVEEHPDEAKLVTIGDSDSGQKILGVAIGNGPVHHLVVATHHGNEYGSTAVASYFAEALARAPIPGKTVFVIPTLNIVGYNNGNREEPDKTGTSRDPNRDYPGPCTTAGPFLLKSTTSLARFVEQQNIVAAATLHTFQPAVAYPWGMDTPDTGTPYDDIFVKLGLAATVESHYQVGNSTKLIYGADGTFEDYVFWKLGIWSLLFELGDTHNPSTADIDEMVRVNLPGLQRLFTVAPNSRAANHTFNGKCSGRKFVDLHDE